MAVCSNCIAGAHWAMAMPLPEAGAAARAALSGGDYQVAQLSMHWCTIHMHAFIHTNIFIHWNTHVYMYEAILTINLDLVHSVQCQTSSEFTFKPFTIKLDIMMCFNVNGNCH